MWFFLLTFSPLPNLRPRQSSVLDRICLENRISGEKLVLRADSAVIAHKWRLAIASQSAEPSRMLKCSKRAYEACKARDRRVTAIALKCMQAQHGLVTRRAERCLWLRVSSFAFSRCRNTHCHPCLRTAILDFVSRFLPCVVFAAAHHLKNLIVAGGALLLSAKQVTLKRFLRRSRASRPSPSTGRLAPSNSVSRVGGLAAST